MYLLSIASAVRSVRIANAYFVPDSLAVATLVAARRRGACGRDHRARATTSIQKIVRRASRSLWGPLLEAGVEIYEYQPTMYHVKVVIVDEVWTSVGSTNFDNRSFRLNDEANLNILDAEFASGQVEGVRGGQGAVPPDHAGGVAPAAVDASGSATGWRGWCGCSSRMTIGCRARSPSALLCSTALTWPLFGIYSVAGTEHKPKEQAPCSSFIPSAISRDTDPLRP